MPTLQVTRKQVSAAAAKATRNKGTGSFFLDILGAPLLKRPALSEAVARYRRGLTRADVAAGEAVAKRSPSFIKKVLTEEQKLPVKRYRGGYEVSKVRKVRRLSAPLVKSQKFVLPILAYEGLRRLMGGGAEKAQVKSGANTMTRDEQAVLLKAGSLIEKLGKENEYLLDQLANALHEKSATKLAREMVNNGLVAAEDMEKKAEELSKEDDLGVVRKAVDLVNSDGFELGKIEKRAAIDGVADGEQADEVTSYLVGYIHGK